MATPLTSSPPCPVEADPRWTALVARDSTASFVYAVKTTGVYAYPGAPSRLPKAENVEFFESAAAAEAAGYRPSRRHDDRPAAVTARHHAQVVQACQRIEAADSPPSLALLAREAGMSPHHFHRIFKAVTGLTPKAYAAALRGRRLRQQLDQQDSVTNALHEAGFNSSSRLYEAADSLLGMTPRDYRAGGINQAIRFAVGECSLGTILVARSQRGVCAILLGDDPDLLVKDLQDRFPQAELTGADPDFEQLVARVVGVVEAPGIGLDLPLDIRGTAFQERVWQALRGIPSGRTASYAEIAERIGLPRAVRAVARACGANTLAVAIPCHRVIRQDGGLSGYRWGVERKRELLRREAEATNPGTPEKR